LVEQAFRTCLTNSVPAFQAQRQIQVPVELLQADLATQHSLMSLSNPGSLGRMSITYNFLLLLLTGLPTLHKARHLVSLPSSCDWPRLDLLLGLFRRINIGQMTLKFEFLSDPLLITRLSFHCLLYPLVLHLLQLQ
jgi:hypothetical protein